MSKEERRLRREQRHEQEVASRAEDFEFLASKKLTPYVKEGGRDFSVGYNEWDYPEGLGAFLENNSHIAALIAECQEEARSEAGQRILKDAYKLFRGIEDMREDYS